MTKLKIVKVTRNNYPPWTCSDCAYKAGGKWKDKHIATFHQNICPVCGELKSVTEPRDYGYPKYKNVIDPEQWRDLTKEDDKN